MLGLYDFELVKIDLRDKQGPLLGESCYLFLIKYLSAVDFEERIASFTRQEDALSFVLTKLANGNLVQMDEMQVAKDAIVAYLDDIGFVSSERLRMEGVIKNGQKSENEGA